MFVQQTTTVTTLDHNNPVVCNPDGHVLLFHDVCLLDPEMPVDPSVDPCVCSSAPGVHVAICLRVCMLRPDQLITPGGERDRFILAAPFGQDT